MLSSRLFLIMAAAGALLAQDPRGKMLGLVTDASGGLVPGAKITATQIDMNTHLSALSNASGNYELPYLVPGPYQVVVTASGFKRYTRGPVEVRVGDSITVDIQLEVGAVTESVEVRAEAPLLETSSASVAQVMDRHDLSNLPMAEGNPSYLVYLAPGVQGTGISPSDTWHPAAGQMLDAVSLAGTKAMGEAMIDGMPVMSRRQSPFNPPADMVREMRVNTVNYDASFGHVGGGAINMSMRAGTNALHGSADARIMPNPWQANDFFTNRRIYDTSTGPVTEEKKKTLSTLRKYNAYDVTLGGPVLLPKVYNGRNRTFWMFGFQSFARVQRSTSTYTVPTPAERQGDFSQLLKAGSIYQIYDPNTIAAAAGGRFSRQPFPGNIIPAARIDPLSQKYLASYNLPNAAGTLNGTGNFLGLSGNNNNFTQYNARVDETVSDKNRFFTRFNTHRLHLAQATPYATNASIDRHHSPTTFAIDDVHVFSPSLLLNMKYGFTRYFFEDRPVAAGYDLTSLGFPAATVGQMNPDAIAFPVVNISGFNAIGKDWSANNRTTTYHTWSGTLNHTAGAHSMKTGGEYRLYYDSSDNLNGQVPSLAFAETWTRGPLDNSPVPPVGQGLASLLLGLPTGGSITLGPPNQGRSTFTGLFFQDDWKVSRKLTVNFGIRWEYEAAPTESLGRSVRGYDFATLNPVDSRARAAYAQSPIPEVPVSSFRTVGGLTFTGLNGQPLGFWTTSKKNFAPRIGFAWQLLPKTVLRGGYGIFYDGIGVDVFQAVQTGFSRSTSVVPSQDDGLTFRGTIHNPFPDGIFKPDPPSAIVSLGQGVSFFPSYRPNPYVQHFSLSLDRELPGRMVLSIMYLGSRSTRLSASQQFDPIPAAYLSTSPERDNNAINFLSAAVNNPFFGLPEFASSTLTARTVATSQLLRPYPQFTSITSPLPIGFSWYHSLEVRTEKRFSRGFKYTAAYTFAKNMEAVQYLNDTDASLHHVISANDRPHRFVLSGIYEFPIGRGKRLGGNLHPVLNGIAGGWQAQGIFQAQTGPPLGFGNIIFRGDIHDLSLPRDQRSAERWFNTDAGFETAPAKQLASNIRAFPLRLSGVRAPGTNYWDLAAYKQFSAGERLKVQLRGTMEGAMNHPQFGVPNTAPNNMLFGQITSIQSEPRRVMVSLRLMF
jgi:Carboxypeptidase regulatory-like domain/TonB dependent receptor